VLQLVDRVHNNTDRKTFLAQIGRGSSVKNIREHDVMICKSLYLIGRY